VACVPSADRHGACTDPVPRRISLEETQGSESLADLFLLQQGLELGGQRADLHGQLSTFDHSVNIVNSSRTPVSVTWWMLCHLKSDCESSGRGEKPRIWPIPVALGGCAFFGACFWFGSRQSASQGPPSAVQDMLEEVGSSSSSSSRRLPRDVVEDLGFGPAQLWMLFLLQGPSIFVGIELNVLSTAVTSTATTMGLSEYETGLLQSACTFGRIPGALVGGWLGDRLGRRPLIVSSILFMAFGALGISVAPNYTSLLWCRAAYGFADGIGGPNATSVMIELTPKRWRVVVFVIGSLSSICGAFFANLLCWAIDPTLEMLNWRLCTQLIVPPLLVFFILQFVFLDESPMFSACVGDHTKAELAFEQMRQLNACPEVDISYADSLPSNDMDNDRIWTGSFWDHLRVMFAYGVFGCTVTLIILQISDALLNTGRTYGLTRVIILEADKHDLTAGMQVLVSSGWGFLALLMPLALDSCMTRKNMLLVSNMILAVSCTCFAWSAHTEIKNWVVQMIFQLSIGVDKCTIQTILMLAGLVTAECYPTAMRSTGVAVMTFFKTIASSMGPLVFEWFHVQFGLPVSFYYALSGLTLFNVLTISGFLPQDMESVQMIATERLNVILSQSLPKAPREPRNPSVKRVPKSQ